MNRLLLVESDPDMREALLNALAELELAAAAVESVDGVAAALRHDHYALVLADIVERPEDFGAAVHRLVQAAAPIPVVAMTAFAFERELAAHGAVAAVLRKPFTLEQLIEVIALNVPSQVHEQPRAVVDAYFHALASSDWDGLAALCAPEIVYELPGSTPLSATVRGRQAFRDFSEQTFRRFRQPRFTIERLFSIGKGVVTQYRGSWASAPAPVDGTVLFWINGALIERIKVHLDVARVIGAKANQ